METSVPIPKPRPSPLPRMTVADSNLKKPVPMPRLRIFKEPDSSVTMKTGVREDLPRVTSDSLDKGDVSSKFSTRNVKGELKLASDSVQERTKQVIENTRNVGARFKHIARRLTVRPASPNKDFTSVPPKTTRSQSLPSEDIFQSISFISPLVNENESNETLAEEGDDDYDHHSFGAPPPIYPPPPLPDESVYDEVQSVLSNHSSNNRDSYYSVLVSDSYPQSDSIYESVAIGSSDQLPSKSRIASHADSSNGNNKCVDGEQVTIRPVARSESWTFYDAASGPGGESCDQDDSSSSYYMNAKDSTSFLSCRTQSCSSISPSLLSELDALGYASGDEMFEDERSSSSPARSSTSQSVSVQNELYDSWEPKQSIPPVAVRHKEGRKLPSQSVILEFDPLFENLSSSIQNSKSDELLFLGSVVKDKKKDVLSPYGKINKLVKQIEIEEFYDNISEGNQCPPVPPRRIDSISQTVNNEKQIIATEIEETAEVFVPPPRRSPVRIVSDEEVQYSVAEHNESIEPLQSAGSSESSGQDESPTKQLRNLVRWTSMKRAMKLVTDSSNWSPSVIRKNSSRLNPKEGKIPLQLQQNHAAALKELDNELPTVVERPKISMDTTFSHSGMVYKVATGRDKQDHVQRWCVLAEGKLTFYSDKTGTGIREVISLSSILSIHAVMDYKISSDGDCFEINTGCRSRNFVFGASGTSERRLWMQKILECMTSVFPLRIISEYTRAGWCFLKEGISGTWTTAWILIHRRLLYYCFPNCSIQEVDLRKARFIVLQDVERDIPMLRATEKGPLILLDCQGQVLYLRMDTSRESTSWQKVIRAAAVDNGPNLSQQQLTRDDIPCIVDKCIKFVYAYGSMSEGIYRRSGANSCVTRLLELFRLDAFAVQLSRQEYTEYDVSSVLKRFFRDLPEPLFTTELHGELCDTAAGKYGKDHIERYRRILERLPPINFLTTRKLIGHLNFIHSQREKNRMPVENLAAIWGPTLLHVEASESLEWSKLETAVIADLISMHAQLFEVDEEEMEREKRMQKVLEIYHTSNSQAPQNKQSGELHVWIYLHSKETGDCINITIGPQKLAGEVCTDLAEKMGMAPHELGLQEVICGGALTRMLHHTETVLDTVLRWGYWDDADRKDNVLILRKNMIFKEVLPLAKPPLSMCSELRFADRKTKSFKTYLFEFSQAKLCFYKDKRGSVKVDEWRVEDIIWYLGYEPKRNPQMRWAITFINKNKAPNRTKERPFFGYTMAGTTKEEQLKWMAALLIGEYPQGLMMSPVLLH